MSMYNGGEAPSAEVEPKHVDSSLIPTAPSKPEAHAAPSAPEAHKHPEPIKTALSSQTDDRRSASVIGSDLIISGQQVHVISKGTIRVEGRIQGDVRGTDVVIGDVGKVEGIVSGDTVKVYGIILGTIRGVQVEIEDGAKVEADIHHRSLSVNAGAQIEGRLRRARDVAELKDAEPVVEAAPEAAAPNVPLPPPQPSSAAQGPRRGRTWS